MGALHFPLNSGLRFSGRSHFPHPGASWHCVCGCVGWARNAALGRGRPMAHTPPRPAAYTTYLGIVHHGRLPHPVLFLVPIIGHDGLGIRHHLRLVVQPALGLLYVSVKGEETVSRRSHARKHVPRAARANYMHVLPPWMRPCRESGRGRPRPNRAASRPPDPGSSPHPPFAAMCVKIGGEGWLHIW